MSQANPTRSGLLRRIVSSLLLLPFLLAVLYPFLWMVFGIFKTNREIYQPLRLVLQNFLCKAYHIRKVSNLRKKEPRFVETTEL